MSYDLTEYVLYHYSTAAADETRHIFNQLQVRIPVCEEFYRTSDKGALVFLDDVACCIRITNDIEHPHIRHDRILQPLWTKMLSSQDARIDIYPGIPQNTDEGLKQKEEERAVRSALTESLAKDGIFWWDNTIYNMGRIAYGDTQHGLVIDMGSVKYFTDEVKEIRQRLAAQSPQLSIQQAVFGELYESFEKAFPAGQKTADAWAMNDSWQLCREFTRRGLLVPTWQSINYSGTTDAAAQYNKRGWQFALETA